MTYLTAKGFLTEHERNALFAAAAAVPFDGFVVNIGVEYGASLVCLRAGGPNTYIVGIDIDNSKVEPEAKAAADVLITADSGDVAAKWMMGDIDLLFIDGDHTFEGVMRDIKLTQYVVVGGTVIFHDCYAWGEPPKTEHKLAPGVNRAVIQAMKNSDLWEEMLPIDSMRIFVRLHD